MTNAPACTGSLSLEPIMRSVTPDRFDAVLFDLDGVVTATARLHARAWKQAFDEFLEKRADGHPFVPFDLQADYEAHVDGKPRLEGAQGFLDSRGIGLPRGEPDDPPGRETLRGIANRKTRLFEEALEKDRVEVYETTLNWIRHLRRAGIKTAVVSSSGHCEAVLRNAGIAGLFDARVDGVLASRLRLPGKPAPDTYLHAAAMLGVEPGRAVVVEDALAGVEAGRNGRFGLVIGVDRKNDAEALRDHGAHIVVGDLGAMLPTARA